MTCIFLSPNPPESREVIRRRLVWCMCVENHTTIRSLDTQVLLEMAIPAMASDITVAAGCLQLGCFTTSSIRLGRVSRCARASSLGKTAPCARLSLSLNHILRTVKLSCLALGHRTPHHTVGSVHGACSRQQTALRLPVHAIRHGATTNYCPFNASTPLPAPIYTKPPAERHERRNGWKRNQDLCCVSDAVRERQLFDP